MVGPPSPCSGMPERLVALRSAPANSANTGLVSERPIRALACVLSPGMAVVLAAALVRPMTLSRPST